MPEATTVQMQWHIVPTKAEFNEGTKVAGNLYFIEDTGEIYRGDKSYTESVHFYLTEEELPAANLAAINVLYIKKSDGSGKVSDGVQWVDAIKPMTNALTRVEWDGTEAMLDLYAGEVKAQSIVFDGLGVSLSYDKATGNVQLVDAKGQFVGEPIKIDLERFVTGGEYLSDTKEIVLYFDGKTGEESTDKVSIPVGDLVDVYTVRSSKSVKMVMEANEIVASIRLSAEDGNELVVKEDGLYMKSNMDLTIIENRISALETTLATIQAGLTTVEGKANDAKALAQAAQDSANAAATAAATAQAAAEAAQTGVNTNAGAITGLDTRLTKAEQDIKTLATTGSVNVDGVTIVADPDTGVLSVGAIDIDKVNELASKLATTLTNESISTEMPTAASASDTKVPSEKVLVDALSWKTGM